MKEEKRQKFIEVLITLGGIIGTFLSIFPPVFTGTIMLFSLFIVFSLLYYVFTLEGLFDKKISFLRFYKFFISFVISVSFSGIFAILLLRGMSSIDMITLTSAIIIYIFLSLILLIFLGGYEKKFKIYTDKFINIFKMKKYNFNIKGFLTFIFFDFLTMLLPVVNIYVNLNIFTLSVSYGFSQYYFSIAFLVIVIISALYFIMLRKKFSNKIATKTIGIYVMTVLFGSFYFDYAKFPGVFLVSFLAAYYLSVIGDIFPHIIKPKKRER